jgi:hypothetical protein
MLSKDQDKMTKRRHLRRAFAKFENAIPKSKLLISAAILSTVLLLLLRGREGVTKQEIVIKVESPKTFMILQLLFVFAKEEESLRDEFALAKGERTTNQDTMMIQTAQHNLQSQIVEMHE